MSNIDDSYKASILFSDVDGCLLGQRSACFATINAAMHRLEKSFLVVLVTGKTAHEVIHLNHQLKLPGPFIIENGHGILMKSDSSLNMTFSTSWPQAKNISLGDYSLFPLGKKFVDRSTLRLISPANSLLTEMADDYLASLTGISSLDAILAKRRFFTEPIFISNQSQDQVKNIKKQLANKKFFYSQSSRFLHVTQSFSSKGRAIGLLLKSPFFEKFDKTYAIGDSMNDFSMFAHCEKNYYIANKPYSHLPPRCEIIVEKELSGWLQVVSQLI